VITFALLVLYLSFDWKLFLTRLNQSDDYIEDRMKIWIWRDTKEEKYCQAAHELEASKALIPDVVHFVLLADGNENVELSYSNFLAIKSALLRINASKIKIHTTGLNVANEWWNKIKNHVELITIDRGQHHAPDGQALTTLRLAHQSDIIRLDILQREGGIYLDTDVFVFKSFSNLLTNPRDVVMGHEGANRYGLCNAVTMARPNSRFIELWRESYSTFDPERWNDHSVKMPKLLQVQHPDLVCPLNPKTFFWPTWAVKHIEYMHAPITLVERLKLEEDMARYGGVMYENQLAFHAVAARDQMAALTPEILQQKDTRFNILVRPIASAPLPATGKTKWR
jgi:hypothetical protein